MANIIFNWHQIWPATVANILSILITAFVSAIVSNLILNKGCQVDVNRVKDNKDAFGTNIGSEWIVESSGPNSAYVLYKERDSKNNINRIRKVLPKGHSFTIPNAVSGQVLYKRYKWSLTRRSAPFGIYVNKVKLTKLRHYIVKIVKNLKELYITHKTLKKTSKDLRKLLKLSNTSSYLAKAYLHNRSVPSFIIEDSSTKKEYGGAFLRTRINLPIDYFIHLANTKIKDKLEQRYTNNDWHFEIKVSREELRTIAKYLSSLSFKIVIQRIERPKAPSDLLQLFLNSQNVDEVINVFRKKPIEGRAISAYHDTTDKRIVMFDPKDFTNFTLYNPSYTVDNRGMLFRNSKPKDGSMHEIIYVGYDGLVVVAYENGTFNHARITVSDVQRLRHWADCWKEW